MSTQLVTKAVAPASSVHKARSILHDCGIFTIEHWVHNPKLPISVRVNVFNLPMGTNGKGKDYPYALASGYGEFMERLQTLLLLNDSKYTGNQKACKPAFPDCQELPLEYFKKHHPEFISALIGSADIDQLGEIFNRHHGHLESLPLLNLTTGETVYLPGILVDISIGSNGMCAGNTPPEALIQGLSEVYERHVLKEIHINQAVRLPLVPDALLQTTPQWEYIEYIRSEGFDLYVKDCSLNGRFPVVGVLLVKDNKAVFNLGASPNFSIALERCISEILQGVKFGNLGDIAKPIAPLQTQIPGKKFSTDQKQFDFQYFTNLICGQGLVPEVVFDHTASFEASHLHNSADVVSDAAWRAMLKSASDAGYQVLCRDVSWLGFNTYQIYVPGLSEVMGADIDLIRQLALNVPKARSTFYNLGTASQEEIAHLITTLESLNDEPVLQKEDILSLLHGLSFKERTSLDDTPPEAVIAMLYYLIGEYQKAHDTLEGYIADVIGPEGVASEEDYAQEHLCLLSYFSLLSKGMPLDEVPQALRFRYQKETVDTIYEMLKAKESISEYLNIPECRNCADCSYEDVCNYQSWLELTERIQAVMAEKNYSSIENLKQFVM